MFLRTFAPRLILLLALFAVTGCGGGESAEVPAQPPQGWQSQGGRWWQKGVDTTRAFRDLSSLQAMGLASSNKVYATTAADVSADQMAAAVKKRLAPMYRNQPDIIDSLFGVHVRPKVKERMETKGIGSSLKETVSDLKTEGYKALRNVFREPRSTTKLGKDVKVTYPDSLRQQGVGGRVRLQVFLNDEGHPQAMRILEGTGNAILDQGALQTVANSRWQPAYVMQNGSWHALPSWVRYSLNFKS